MRLNFSNDNELSIEHLWLMTMEMEKQDPFMVIRNNTKIAQQLAVKADTLTEKEITSSKWQRLLENFFFTELVGPHKFLLPNFSGLSLFHPDRCIIGKHKLVSVMGKGTYSCVFRTAEGDCLKISSPENREKLLREYNITQELRHKYVIKYKEFCSGSGYAAILMEPLEHKLGKEQEYLEGLTYCHSKGFLHGDLRLKNLGMDSDGNSKLFDFGNSRPLNTPDEAEYEVKCLHAIIQSPFVSEWGGTD